ncbi:MAG: LysR family transcriptional regulator [Myxococcota bacterium]
MALKSWDDLRFVLAVSREGTLTGAAKELGVDQTTVTRRLRSIERQIDMKLFDVLRGGVKLTPAGEALVDTAGDVEGRLLALGRLLDGSEQEPTGPIRLTLSHPLAATWVGPLRRFAEEHPRLELELVVDDDFRNLTRREADVALRRVASPPEHLVGRKLSRVADAVYGAPALKDRPLDELPWFGWSPETSGSILEDARRRYSPRRPFVMYATSMLVLLEAARRGETALVLSCVVGDTDPGLVRLSAPKLSDKPLWVLTHPDLRQSPRVRALMDYLSEFVMSQQDALVGRGAK